MRYNRNSTLTDDRCFTTKLLPKIRKLSLASSTGSMEHCPTCTVNAIHAFSASYKHSAMTDWTKWMTRKEEEKRAARTQTRVKTLDHQYLTICRLIVSTVAADTARNHASAETLTVMNTFINAFVCFRRCLFSLCFRSAFALLSLCFRSAFALLSLCFCFVFALLSLASVEKAHLGAMFGPSSGHLGPSLAVMTGHVWS